MSNLIGRMVGAYQIEKKIGEGGNSDVYIARDTVNNRPVALKVLRLEHQSDRAKVERFWRGGHNARELQHPHIVPVYDAGLADSRYYIAMEYMAGRSIEDLLSEHNGPLPWPTTLHYLDQIAEAIDYAHSRGVIHRDIKPSNILLSADRRTACLTDFGISLLTGQETLTDHGTLVGTPEFISPEQIRGQTADARSDIYSLGITAYQMLSGALPFEGPPATVLYNHTHTPPPSIHRANADLPGGMARPINKSLAKDPQRRYATARDFARDLGRVAGRRRPRWVLWGLLAVLALLIGVLAFFPPITPPPIVTMTPPMTATPVDIIIPPVVTSTVAPTSQPTSTAQPTVPATDPPATPPTTPPGSTRTPIPPTATAADTLSLLAPADGADIPRNAANQAFRWEWDRPLAENESFELRFYPQGGGAALTPFGWSKQNSVTVDLNNLPAGRYRWVVAVVRGMDGNWEEDIAVSPFTSLLWGR